VRKVLILGFTELAMNLELSKDVNIFRAFEQISASQRSYIMEAAGRLFGQSVD
jgi:hypothetical protein